MASPPPMKAAMWELWHATTNLVGATVLIVGAVAGFIYCWLAISDWVACEGKWARCTECGQRTRAKE